MKKKIINGILLVAMLFAASSAFVSCKDTDADYKSETDAKISQLEQKLASLQDLVSKIKSCECDMTSINSRLANLEAAVKTIPSLDGYLKTADLPAQVQALLVDYYTKAQVDELLADYAKKSDIPEVKEVDLSGYFTKDEIANLLKEYAKTGDIKEVDLSNYLTSDQITELLKDYAKKGEITGGVTEDKVKELIGNALKEYAKKTELPTTFTKEEIIKIINETVTITEEDLTNIYLTEVTSIAVDQVTNPLFSFISPLGIKANVLLTYFGEKARRDIYFPRGTEEPIVYKGDYIIEGTGNAGKLYVTVNPSSVNFSGKTLKMMTTGGEEAPVELTPLEESNKNLMFLSRGDNAFYETFATIPAEKIAKAYVSWEPEDMEAFKDEIKLLLNERNKRETVEMIKTIYNLIVNNDVPAYRLQAAWGENMFTYSEANIAAVAIKPLSYAFDLESEAQYDGDAITALEKLESKIVKWGTKSTSAQAKIWRFLDKFNIGAEKVLTNINWAIQPTLLISTEDEVSHPDVYAVGTSATVNRYAAGEIKLLPTSWSAEILAPAFKKYVAVVEVDGVAVDANDPVNEGLLGQVIPGSVKEIPFKVEAGKTYKIQYSAVDYEGNIKNLYYYIRGFKNN